MKTALTIMQSNGHISPMFDTCRRLIVIRCCHHETEGPECHDFPETFSDKLILLQSLGIQTLICGAISNEDAAVLEEQGIRVCSFTSGPWKEVWQEWHCHRQLTGQHMLPGCCRRQNCPRFLSSIHSPSSNRKEQP